MEDPKSMRSSIRFSLNGRLHSLDGKYAFLPFSDYLRYEKALTGTKVVCSEGDCGACTVMILRPGIHNNKFVSINSCIAPSMLLDGCHVITIEALKEEESLNEIQESMVRNFGSQCGFCTPGFVMSFANMFEQTTKLTEQKVKNYLTGNLCRCTGYYSIIEAALDIDLKKIKPLINKFDYEPLTNKLKEDACGSVMVKWGEKEFYAPTTIKEALNYKQKNKSVRIVSGATDVGVQANKGKDPGTHLMSLHLVKELYNIQCEEGWISVGSKVTINTLQKYLEDKSKEFSEFLNIFASPQIKNTATLVGNVANGSPIADTTPYLLTAEAQVELVGLKGPRTVALTDFITGYKTFDLKPDEFITSLRFKVLDKNMKVGLYKVSQRRDLDISCVNSSFVFDVKKNKINQARIALGGVAEKTIRLNNIENDIKGKELNEELIKSIKNQLIESISPLSDARGTAEFRSRICGDLFDKYIQEHFS